MASNSWLRYFVEGGFYNPLMAGSIDGTDKIPHDHGIVRAMKAKCENKTPLRNKYRL